MKPLLVTFVLLLACLGIANLIGCSGGNTTKEEKPAMSSELVGEVDGVRLWRVVDHKRGCCGQTVYVATPSGNVSWDTTRTEGKSTVTDHHQTVNVPRGEAKP